MKYEFHVGDYVETKNDARGYVEDVNELIWRCTQSSNDYMYVAGRPYFIPVEFDSRFNRIGQYDFTKKAEDKNNNKIEPLCEEYTKSFPICEVTNMGYTSECYSFDLGVVGKKINELVDVINRLEEKVSEMAQS